MPRGRQPGFTMSNEHRDKIKNSNILNALIEHAQGDREMSASQVTAGLGLLRKVMPDLQAMSLEGEMKLSADATITGLMQRIAANGRSIHDKS